MGVHEPWAGAAGHARGAEVTKGVAFLHVLGDPFGFAWGSVLLGVSLCSANCLLPISFAFPSCLPFLSFHTYLLRARYVPGTVLDSGGKAQN